MKKRAAKNRLDFATLETRRCLAVGVNVADNGALRVFGDADGPVEIVAAGEGSFEVSDAGNSLGVFEGVDKIRILLDREAGADNEVHIQLNDETVDGIFAALGHGNDLLTVRGSESIGRVDYRGGQGDDTVRVDVATEQIVSAVMGGGDDALAVGENGHRIRFRGGPGNDALYLTAETDVNFVGAILGDGDNEVNVMGDVTRSMFIGGGRRR